MCGKIRAQCLNEGTDESFESVLLQSVEGCAKISLGKEKRWTIVAYLQEDWKSNQRNGSRPIKTWILVDWAEKGESWKRMARGVAIDPSVDRSMDRFVYAGSWDGYENTRRSHGSGRRRGWRGLLNGLRARGRQSSVSWSVCSSCVRSRCGAVLVGGLLRGGGLARQLLQIDTGRVLVGGGHDDDRGLRGHEVQSHRGR